MNEYLIEMLEYPGVRRIFFEVAGYDNSSDIGRLSFKYENIFEGFFSRY